MSQEDPIKQVILLVGALTNEMARHDKERMRELLEATLHTCNRDGYGDSVVRAVAKARSQIWPRKNREAQLPETPNSLIPSETACTASRGVISTPCNSR
ncbi:hypothetical protein A8U91_01337 [Halomonas elongata]|uniref:Uncharacterized protein n=1 Tax=Halomonas elongata TaxID=2746 RepID=A0A1B8P429_HALEL|nr:hypothetical protein A8U91_01337 [Halomonas elongata]